MTEEEKIKQALAEKDREIADLKAKLADRSGGADEFGDDVRARSVAEAEAAEAEVPTPTQAELDRVKSGEAHAEAKSGTYKTRQARAG